MTAGRPLSIENHLDVERPLSVARHGARNRGATVEIVIPVYDEAATLEAGVRRLRAYLDDRFPFDTIATVADNASTDGTWGVAARLAAQAPGCAPSISTSRGRGRALREVWSTSQADVVAYMDADLSTELDAILPLVAPLISGHSDVAIGSRLARGAHVVDPIDGNLVDAQPPMLGQDQQFGVEEPVVVLDEGEEAAGRPRPPRPASPSGRPCRSAAKRSTTPPWPRRASPRAAPPSAGSVAGVAVAVAGSHLTPEAEPPPIMPPPWRLLVSMAHKGHEMTPTRHGDRK